MYLRAQQACTNQGKERERERFPEQQEQNRAAFLLVSEAWRAELPLGVEARAWRRHAVSRSAMRMQAVQADAGALSGAVREKGRCFLC